MINKLKLPHLVSTFGERLRELRLEKGLSIKKLAAELGIDDTTIGSWEKGEYQPQLSMLYMLVAFFNVSMDYLTGLKDE